MKRFLGCIITLLFMDLLFQQCANPGSPTGGPKDTIPPTLISSYPANGTLNFKGQEFRFIFSEYINADKLRQQLIITPKIDINYKSTVRKNELILKFEEPFNDSTTYNLNFSESITDITEKNPVINFSLAFSTGNYIDSMSIDGYLIDLFDQKPVKAYTVGLYNYSDTLDYFKESPSYFTTTNDSGIFQLQYVKSANYKLIAFKDDNKNIILDPQTEPHGFVEGTIKLDSSVSLKSPIPVLLQDIKPITFINSRPTGPYIELKYSKTINEYSITPDIYNHNIIGETQDAIRLYKPANTNTADSIQLIVQVADSLDNTSIDTIASAFVESNRKPTDLSWNLISKEKELKDKQVILTTFNKPITSIDTNKIYFAHDTTFQYNIQPTLDWNENNTILTIGTEINKDNLLLKIHENILSDSTDTDTTATKKPVDIESIDLVIDRAAFISIENDTTQRKSITLNLKEKESYGTLKFNITTKHPRYNLQLINNKKEVVYSHKESNPMTFSRVSPDNYTIRVLIDDNQDGRWSAGNLLLDVPPESIYLYPEPTSVRENWALDIDISF